MKKLFKLRKDLTVRLMENRPWGEIAHTFEDAFENADVVIPKSWGPLVTTEDVNEGLKLIEKYPSWRCDARRMALGKDHLIYMHPLPADRGREVTDEVIDGLLVERSDDQLGGVGGGLAVGRPDGRWVGGIVKPDFRSFTGV